MEAPNKYSSKLEGIYISALRYALGRSTYVVHETASFILDEADNLSQQALRVIVQDLEEYFERRKSVASDMQMDYEEWKKLYKTLKPKIKE